MTSPTRTRGLAAWVPPVADLLVVVVFVVLGRRSHDDGGSLAGFLRVWWPFAVGLGVSALLAGSWVRPFAWRRVTVAWVGTVAVGMALRLGVQGRDLRPSFVVVTTLVLGAGLFGWRLGARRLTRGR